MPVPDPFAAAAARLSRPARAAAAFGLLALACAGLSACDSGGPTENEKPIEEKPAESPPLRKVAEQRGFRIGTTGDKGFRLAGQEGTTFRTIVGREFNVLTPENDMKHERLQPSRGVYAWGWADSLVAFARANNMQVRGHTLVWHQQNARWMTTGTWTRDEARALLADHVTRVVEHFRGQVVAWDVVNEAVADDGTMRSSVWSQSVGPDYIERAFRAARAADPSVPLFYNDYSTEWVGPKSNAVLALLTDLKARGVPVAGIGFQAHFAVGQVPSKQALIDNFARFAALGLKIHITELDVRVPAPATAASLQAQAQAYRDVTEACLQTPACEMLVVWGVTDKDSWVPSTFPGQGDALLYDAAYQAKPSYWAVHNALSGK